MMALQPIIAANAVELSTGAAAQCMQSAPVPQNRLEQAKGQS